MFRRSLLFILLAAWPLTSFAELRVFDFDDGTLQGFSYVNVDDEPYPLDDPDEAGSGWIVSAKDIDLGENDWKLLQGTSVNGLGTDDAPQRVENYRIIPEPWENRDCIGDVICQSQVLKSPLFKLDDSGPISVDMMGGQATDGRNFDPENDVPPEFPQDFDFVKSGDGWQGFALYDVADDAYVRWAFPTFTNDGKEKDGRGVWERVTIPTEELSGLAGDGKQYRLDVFDSYQGGWGWIGIDTVQIPILNVKAVWDGGDGEWTDANWNGGLTAEEMFGRTGGSDGAKNVNGGEQTTIGGGVTVSYDASVNGDFRIKQGSSLTITEGSTWVQDTTAEYSENRWTQMDLSSLVLDNGTFRRTGAAALDGNPEDPKGGGALIVGSWRGDDNFDSGKTPWPQTVDIQITNGGSFENEGQLWFGAGEDHTAGLNITVTIDDGTIDLTGGDVTMEGVTADWAMFFDIDTEGKFTAEAGDPKDEQYAVNFTGPGSITVDSAGIVTPTRVEDAAGDLIWTNFEPISYEALWDMGILQANGESGTDGGNFADFFSVAGMVGMDDYTLTSLVGAAPTAFDCNGDGVTTAADLACVDTISDRDAVLSSLGTIAGDLDGDGTVAFADFLILSNNFGNATGTYADGNIDLEGGIAFADFLALSDNFGKTAAASAVPEPSASLLALAGLVGLLAFRRTR